MLEIPPHQNVYSLDGSDGNVLTIGQTRRTDNLFCNVQVGEIDGFKGSIDFFDLMALKSIEVIPNMFRCPLKLDIQNFRNNKSEVAILNLIEKECVDSANSSSKTPPTTDVSM